MSVRQPRYSKEDEVYRDPSSQGCRTKQTRQAEEALTPLMFPDGQLTVANIEC